MVILDFFKKNIFSLPVPINIRYFWNFGSLLGLSLIIQILSGFFLAIHYKNEIFVSFFRVDEIYRNVNLGWLIRIVHRNGARIFFFCLYIHIARGLYYQSYRFHKSTWIVGALIFILTIATAFLGYVLPWGQISLWGATVITNLLRTIPYIGTNVVTWLWGGFSVDAPTVSRFFAFHFLLPFAILALVLIHLLCLHSLGSRNPLGVSSNSLKIKFHSYFLIKDICGGLIYFIIFLFLVFYHSWIFGDSENFILANSIVTPLHIQPEWYFLFAYAILRTIPNKLGGVLALLLSILVLFILPLSVSSQCKSLKFNKTGKICFFNFLIIFFILTWIGSQPASGIFLTLGLVYTVSYFTYFIYIILAGNWIFLDYLRFFKMPESKLGNQDNKKYNKWLIDRGRYFNKRAIYEKKYLWRRRYRRIRNRKESLYFSNIRIDVYNHLFK